VRVISVFVFNDALLYTKDIPEKRNGTEERKKK
jgi:hypothetical protein